MKKYILLFTLMMFTGSVFSQNDNFYYYKGEKINLPISNKMFYVVIRDTIDWASDKLTNEYIVSTHKKGTQSSSKGKTYWKIIQLESKNTKTPSVDLLKTLLADQSNLSFIEPVIENDTPIAISEFFMLSSIRKTTIFT